MVLIRAYCSSARVAFTQSENWGRTGTFASFHLCEKLGKRSVCPWFPCPCFLYGSSCQQVDGWRPYWTTGRERCQTIAQYLGL